MFTLYLHVNFLPTYPLTGSLLKYTDTLNESERFVGIRSEGAVTDVPVTLRDGPMLPGLTSEYS